MTDLTREDRLIIAASRYPLAAGRNQDFKVLASVSLDWEYILRNGGRHGILPMLFQAINDAGARDRVPARSFEQLQMVYFSSLLNNRQLYQELLPLLDAFKEHSVPCILLKGGALCLTIYSDMALRPFGDIDIMVPPGKGRA